MENSNNNIHTFKELEIELSNLARLGMRRIERTSQMEDQVGVNFNALNKDIMAQLEIYKQLHQVICNRRSLGICD